MQHNNQTKEKLPEESPNVIFRYVTGSAKTRHNRASLNFQYKALNTMGEILAYFKKYYGFFLNAWFLEKEMSNIKNLDII